MKNLARILFLTILILFLSGAAQAKNQRFALVIGNSGYKAAPLKNPVNDAVDISRKLKQFGFQVTLKTNADLRQMERAIRKFGKTLRNGGTGLFYFAGHGIQVKGNNYLIPIGAVLESEGDAKYEAVDAGLVLAKMEDAENNLNIVILDACRNNPFARSFRSSTPGLARMDAPTGSLVAYATAPGSVAADGYGRNGVYTKYLLENMDKPGLTIEQVLKQVRIGVLKETRKKQVPWESSSLTGEFYFSSNKTPANAPPVIASLQKPSAPIPSSKIKTKKTINTSRLEAKIEELYYKNATNNLSGALKYLYRFPNGRYVSDVKNRTYYALKKRVVKGKKNAQYLYENDSLGRIISHSWKEDGGRTSRSHYKYNDKGQKISYFFDYVSGHYKSYDHNSYKYNQKGLMIENSKVTTTNSKWSDYKDKITRRSTHYEYNELEQVKRYSMSDGTQSLYKYNSLGQLVERTYQSGTSKYRSQTFYRYNNIGQKIEEVSTSIFSSGEKKIRTTVIKYDANGSKTKEIQYLGSSRVVRQTFYDTNGMKNKEIRYEDSGELKEEIFFYYEPIVLR